jgi:hypothetical protein
MYRDDKLSRRVVHFSLKTISYNVVFQQSIPLYVYISLFDYYVIATIL